MTVSRHTAQALTKAPLWNPASQRANRAYTPCVALAIRTWSLLTSRWIFTQSTSERGGAPASVRAAEAVGASAVICFPPFEGWPCSLAMKDLAEVCPLSRRMMLRASGVSPRSIRIPAITVGPSLFPHSFTRTPVGSPCGVPTDWIGGVRAYPVPRMSHERGRPLLSAGSTMVHGRAHTTPCSPRLLSLLGRACQRLWLGRVYDVYQRFTCVGHTALPWPLTA